MNIYDSDSSDSDMLEILSYSVCNYWEKRKSNINTDFFSYCIGVMCYKPKLQVCKLSVG